MNKEVDLNEIRIMIEPNIEPYIKFNLFALYKYSSIKLLYTVCLIVGIIGLILGIFLENYVISVLSIVLITFRYSYNAFIKKVIKKSVKKSPSILTQTELIINQNGMTGITDKSTTTLTWEDFDSIIETKDMIYLFYNRAQGFYIDKELLNSQQIISLRAWRYKARAN